MTACVDNLNISQLWQDYKVQQSKIARDHLIIHYSSLVTYVAGRLAIGLPKSVQKDDLISYGIFGLIEAMERFDLNRGIKFETYAIARIRGAMFDGLRKMDWVPYSVRQKAKQLEKAYSTLEAQLGREATDEEVCEALTITKEQFHSLLLETSATTLRSLDEIWNIDGKDGDSVALIDLIEDNTAVDPVSSAEFRELKKILSDSIGKLVERERLVIALYYYEGLTLKEIGKVLGVSESRVSQMHTKAILRLRGRLSRIKKKIM